MNTTPKQIFIGGSWTAGSETYPIVDPSTGGVFAHACLGRETEIKRAVEAARQAFPEWRDLGAATRAKFLQRVVDLLVEQYGKQGEATALKKLIMTEMGKRLPEADIEVQESADMLAFYANNAAELLETQTLQLNAKLWPTKRSTVVLEPLGVVAMIKPWNYPLELPIWGLGPALAAGNTVVLKPSEYSALVALELARLFQAAGLPPGVLNVVTGDAATGRLLVAHEDVDMVAFTGSVATGREIAIECAKRLRKYTLELGGNDPAIVDSDVDLELASNGLVWGAFCNSGQVCARTKRAYVHKRVYDDLLPLILHKTSRLRAGVDYGPIVSERQLQKLEAQIDDAVSKGAKVLAGGKRVAGKGGFYYEPTVLTDVDPNANLLREECFGPVLPLVRVRDTQEAIEKANDSVYGLGASIWTSHPARAEQLALRLEAGMVWVNDVNVAFPEAPWGGAKNSGPGVELSKYGLFEYVRPKHICIEESDAARRAWWYPY